MDLLLRSNAGLKRHTGSKDSSKHMVSKMGDQPWKREGVDLEKKYALTLMEIYLKVY